MHQDIVRELYSVHKANGYISEDRILDVLIGRNLPLDEIDVVCETLLAMGVIIKDDGIDSDESVYDRSQTDFELIYKEVVEIDKSLTPYIDEVREIRPPQHREWRNLMPSAQSGNTYARERIILMYTRAVVKIALWHHKKYKIPLSEAIQNGNHGLVIALDKYDSGRQDNFSQYASFWVRQLIMRNANPINPLIYYPAHYMDRLLVVLEVSEAHDCTECDTYFICPFLINDVMDKLGCGTDEAIDFIGHLTPMDSLEQLLDENETAFTDNGRFTAQMNDDYFGRELELGIAVGIKHLDERGIYVLTRRFGLFGIRTHTLEEVGNKIGVTRERIRQIEEKCLRKLRKSEKIKGLKVFW